MYESYEGDSKAIWKITNHLTNKTNKAQISYSVLFDGNGENNEREIRNISNSYFIEVARGLAD